MSIAGAGSSRDGFVRVSGGAFERGGKPYRFVGANLWYGMNLGASGEGRARLVRELDRLRALGVTNLRALAASEGPESEPWRIAPALQPAPGQRREELLSGVSHLLSEAGRRGMTVVLCLTNFWPWSGGMAQYLRWSGASPIPYPPPNPGGTWMGFQAYAQDFYSNAGARKLFEDLLREIVPRFRDEPALLAWELANEPRGASNAEAFHRWIGQTSRLLKQLDPNHLVTTGSEGETPWPGRNGLDFTRDHAAATIDYATAHLWVQNWHYYEPELAEETWERALQFSREYLRGLAAKARALAKPLVLEEFGLARDAGSYDPSSSTGWRDRFYGEIFAEVRRLAAAGEPVSGTNFWAWAGEGRPVKPYGGTWRADFPFTGDPPHEPQGWYGVYDSDVSTHDAIRAAAAKFALDSSAAPL